MAYIINRDEEEQQNRPTATAAPAATSSAPASPFAALAPEQKKASGHQGSGQFYDFSRLLNANQGRGQQLAGQMVQGVNEKINKATGEVGKTVEQFNAAAQGPQGAVQDFNPTDNLGNVNAALFTPGGEQMAAQYRDMHYTGPRALQNTQGAQDAIRDAQQRAQVLSSNRGALLDGNAGYNRGQRAFDVLVSGAGGKQQFDATRKNANVLNKLFTDANAGAAQRVAGIDQQYGTFNQAGQSYYGNRTAAEQEWGNRRSAYEADARAKLGTMVEFQNLEDKEGFLQEFLKMPAEEQQWHLDNGLGFSRTDDSAPLPAYQGPWAGAQPYAYDPYDYFNR